MKKSDFHFDLPPALIAQQPLPQRSASRLLVLDAAADRLADRRFTDLDEYLKPGDLLDLGGYIPPGPMQPGSTVKVKYMGFPDEPTLTVKFQ